MINDAVVRAEYFRGKRVTVVGLGKGRTARGLAEFLVHHGALITVTAKETAEQLREGIERLGDLPVALRLGVGDH